MPRSVPRPGTTQPRQAASAPNEVAELVSKSEDPGARGQVRRVQGDHRRKLVPRRKASDFSVTDLELKDEHAGVLDYASPSPQRGVLVDPPQLLVIRELQPLPGLHRGSGRLRVGPDQRQLDRPTPDLLPEPRPKALRTSSLPDPLPCRRTDIATIVARGVPKVRRQSRVPGRSRQEEQSARST